MTQKTRANLGTSIDTNLASGTNITAAELRPELKDIADSSFNLLSDTMDNIADGATSRIFTAAEKTKLGTIASGATVNSADATLLNRANHTGTQAASTISDFTTATTSVIESAAILQDRVLGAKWAGVVKGAVSGAQRITNGTALQAAINYAAANGLKFFLEAGVYQIDLAGGLVIPPGYQGFEFYGSRIGDGGTYKNSTRIVQYATNTPALVCGSDTGDAYLIIIDGVKLAYGVSQTGQTNANLLLIKSCWRSSFRYLEAGPDAEFGNHKPYRVVNIEGGPYYFQNTMEHCKFGHGQLGTLYIQNNGTGNVWRDLYLGGGLPVSEVIDGSLLYIRKGYDTYQENIFQQINIEWVTCKNPMYISGMRGATFESIHFEGCVLSGDYPALIYTEGCDVQFTGLNILDCRIKDANIGLGTPAIINDGYGSNINIDGAVVTTATSTDYDMAFELVQRGGYESSVAPTQIQIRSFKFIDSFTNKPNLGNMRLTEKTAAGNFTNARFYNMGRFESYGYLPNLKHTHIHIIGNYTLFGFAADGALIVSPTNAGAVRTVTLSDRMGVAGSDGENIKPEIGTTCTVLRGLGSADGNALNVVDHLGNNLATLTTSGSSQQFVFNGVAWRPKTDTVELRRTVTDNTTITLADMFKTVECNKSTAMTVTVPPDSTATFPLGSLVLLTQLGDGQVQVVAGSGVTIRTAESLFLKKKYSAATLQRIGANEWLLSGNLQSA